MFLKLRKMTLDKSPSGSAIEPQFEDMEDEFEKGLHEPSPLPSRTKTVRDSNVTDRASSLSADLGEDVTRLKAVSAETSVELEAQRRDIDRVSAVVRRLERDISQMKDIVENIRSETTTRSTNFALPRPEGLGYPAEELELLTANITSLGAKVNGIEGLKLEFEMMKRRIRRMEDANATQSTSTLAAFPQQSLQSTPVARITRPPQESSQRKRTESIPRYEEYDESDTNPPKSATPVDGPADRNISASRSIEDLRDDQERPRSPILDKPIWDKSIPRHEKYNESNVDPPKSATPEDVPADGNSSASRSSEGLGDNQERPRSSSLDKPMGGNGQLDIDGDKASGSGHGDSEVQGENQTLKHTVSPIFVTPAKRRATKGAEQFFSYDVPIIDNSQDDDYKPRSRSTAVRGASNSPRVRRGSRGRGRGGRSRTGLNTRQYGTPEWEKPDWVDGSSEHQRDTGSTSASKRGGGVSRRGTGGGSYSEPRRAPAQDSMDQVSSQEDTEVYRLTPRSAGGGGSKSRPREQRQRDSEGYLLTAKGTRDGRSQFWKDVGSGLKPNPNMSEEKKAANPSRHAKIMQQIFPDGVEEGKRRSNLAQQLFSRDKSSNGANGELDMESQRGPDASAKN